MAGPDLSGTTAVVTGAGGFFGGHLVRYLLERGAQVRAFLRYRSDGHTGRLHSTLADDRLALFWGDVRDAATLETALNGADLVFHLAALVSVPNSYTDPSGYLQTNVMGTLNLLLMAQATSAGRVVFVSTSEVYGTSQTELIAEEHPLVAQSPYAASKIAAEKVCESFVHSYGMPIVVARPFNLYGPGQSRRAVIAEIVAQAIAGGPVTIGAQSTIRDFNYVTDTVEALVRLAVSRDAVGEVVNIGSGRTTSVNEVLQIVGDVLGRPLEVRPDPSRLRPITSEVRRLCADSTRLRGLIGAWSPRSLRDGIVSVVAQAKLAEAPQVWLP